MIFVRILALLAFYIYTLNVKHTNDITRMLAGSHFEIQLGDISTVSEI